MPYRITPLINGQFYHVFNRGVEKRTLFTSRRDYQRFIKTLNYYQYAVKKPRFSNSFNSPIKVNTSKKLVNIISYCLMPNHFHLLLEQMNENGISEFISKVTNSYTKYFNTKYKRVGSLVQGQFKAVLVNKDEQLIHLNRYIHLNPSTSFLVKKPEEYEWSSYPEYLSKKVGFVVKNPVMGNFTSIKDYQRFINDQLEYAQTLDLIKHSILEEI